MTRRSRAAHRLALALLALTLVSAAAAVARGQSKRPPAEDAPPGDRPRPRGGVEPVEISPSPDARGEAPIEAGEVRLLVLLSELANSTRQSVVVSGVPSEEMVKVAAPIERPDRASIGRVLSAAGYSVSQESYKGRRVLWVSRELRPTGQKGAILRPPQDGGAATGSTESLKPAGGAIRLFRQGDGPGTTYLVLYETASRTEAEDACQVLQSLVENRRAKTEGAPPRLRPRAEKAAPPGDR